MNLIINESVEHEKGTKARPCCGELRAKRKKEIFLIGEVFFLLTRPLMGDTDIL